MRILRTRTFVERVESSVRAVTERDGLSADAAAHDRPLPLRVARHVTLPSKGDRTRRDGFRERALAPADDAREHDVRIGEHSLPVQHPGVVDKARTTPGVLTDQDSLTAETALGEERVGAGKDLARRAMRLNLQPSTRT